MVFPEPKEAYQALSFLLCGEGEKCNNLSFNLEVIPWHAPQIIQPLKPALNVASPWIFVGFIPHHVEYMCLTKACNVLTISYSFWSH